MKRTFKLLIPAFVLLLVLGSITSCKPKLKQAKGVVTNIDASRLLDTIHSVRVLADGDTLLFNVKDADYTNGFVVQGDSVTIDYYKGHGDTLRAIVVAVKPRPAKVIDLDTLKDKPLLTR